MVVLEPLASTLRGQWAQVFVRGGGGGGGVGVPHLRISYIHTLWLRRKKAFYYVKLFSIAVQCTRYSVLSRKPVTSGGRAVVTAPCSDGRALANEGEGGECRVGVTATCCDTHASRPRSVPQTRVDLT